MGRISTCGVIVFAAVSGHANAIEAGGAKAAPPVRVVASTTPGITRERDDLPAPQLEVATHRGEVATPVIPAFGDRTDTRDMEIDLDLDTGPPLRNVVDDATLDASVGHLNACTRATAAKQYDAAIAACRAAVEVWPDNHLAWYAWASAYMARRQWTEAEDAVENAVRLRPDRAMYQLYRGISLYEAEHERARAARAHLEQGRRDPAEPAAAPRLDDAREALTTAIRLAPELWRAHYYLGRIYRELDDPRRAAQQFTATIQTNPRYRFGYIALSELYRRWDHLDQALAVATLGATRVPPGEAAELWFEVGMAHDARRADDPALQAFGRAIAIDPHDPWPKLQRAQIYVRTGDLASAARDLDEVMRSSDPRAASARQLAAGLRDQLAAATSARPSRETRRDCHRSGSAIVCEPRR